MAKNMNVEQLTPLDLLMPRTYVTAVLCFRMTEPTSTISQRLQPALNEVSKVLPWLTGKVFPTAPTEGNPPSLEMRWNSDTDSLTVIDKGTIEVPYLTMAADGMPPCRIPAEVWPVPLAIDDNLFAAGAPVFATSLFRFGDNQGVGLCICAHHNAMDASGFAEVNSLWVQAISGSSLSGLNVGQARVPWLQKALAPEFGALSSRSRDSLFESHPEYSQSFPTFPTEFPLCTSKVFAIPISRINDTKKLVSAYTSTSPTTNTIVSALVWSAISRARMHRDSTLSSINSRLALAVNGKRRIGEGFSTPENPYIGNAVLYALAKHPAQGLASPVDQGDVRTLASVCDAIVQSHSPQSINSRSIAEVYNLVTGMEDYRTLFVGWDLFDSRDLTITSWADLDLYGMDFGTELGRPEFIRVPYNEADGVGLVLPRKRPEITGDEANEVVEVMIMLRRDDMEVLEKNGI